MGFNPTSQPSPLNPLLSVALALMAVSFAIMMIVIVREMANG
jgi:hypothetical protein